ncbi:ATP-binding protein [Phenylobacterium sp.]|uniref:ATP-binding protein n=1 Tax=Phenylobacterium sp. TaxID=1871053 RepID=UPI0019CA7CBE|nr:ATP-binding protein [Phenylobacterium sp.]MBC7167324.1 HAMP domain-containing protein [Phenylobacterium sp.]
MLIADSLSSRITRILLGGSAAVLLVVAIALAWPAPGGGVRFFQLPLPQEAAAIVEAVEASDPRARPRVVRALNTSVIAMRLSQTFPQGLPGTRFVVREDDRYRRYAAALGERAFQIDERLADWRPEAPRRRPAVRLSVQLDDGSILVMQRRPAEAARGLLARGALAMAMVALLMLATLMLAVRQTTRPVADLAAAVRRFGDEMEAEDIPLRGPRELRELALAFNAMKGRIRGLVDDRTRLLAAIAHDLRTYLTRLRLRAEFIGDDAQREKAVRDLDEMSALIDDTLLFAQLRRAGGPAATLDLRAELETLVEVRRELGDAVVLTPGEGVRALVPALAFRRMANNLIDNAVRYGGSAELGLRTERGRAVLSVCDEGPGVPGDQLSRLGAPFERLEASRNRATGGAGLGLAIVRGLAEAQGGDLILFNRHEGGLCAEVRLPLASP